MKAMSKNAVYTAVHTLHKLAVDAELNYPLEQFEQNKAYNKYVINSTEKRPENTFDAMVWVVRHANHVPQIVRRIYLELALVPFESYGAQSVMFELPASADIWAAYQREVLITLIAERDALESKQS